MCLKKQFKSVNQPRKLLTHKKSLLALAKKSTLPHKKKKILVQTEETFLSVLLPSPVTQTLKNLDSEMTDILSSKQLDDE